MESSWSALGAPFSVPSLTCSAPCLARDEPYRVLDTGAPATSVILAHPTLELRGDAHEREGTVREVFLKDTALRHSKPVSLLAT